MFENLTLILLSKRKLPCNQDAHHIHKLCTFSVWKHKDLQAFYSLSEQTKKLKESLNIEELRTLIAFLIKNE